MAEPDKGPKNALAVVEPDRKDVALEIMSPEQREEILTRVAEALSIVISPEQPEEGASQQTPDPRILRLLNALDPVLYQALKTEMAATLTLIASPTTDPEMKAALQEEMKRTIEARLGPAFSHIAFAVGLLSGDDFCLDSVNAAVGDLPNTVAETPPETRFLRAARALIELKVLRITTDKSLEGMKAFIIQYVFEEAGKDCILKFSPTPIGRFQHDETAIEYGANIADADCSQLVSNLETLCAQIGLRVIIEVAPECLGGVYKEGKQVAVRKISIYFDFENPPSSRALTKL